jgi:signal peptide peptidase-like protein 2B
MLRTIRLPSFKICFVLLSLLFFYDIFFVFLTPLLTTSGDSVMVEVATGGSKGDDVVDDGGTSTPRETLPMVLRVPHLSIKAVNASDPLECCYRDLRSYSYSLLGFGDILVPGLLVSYCHAFDLIHSVSGRPYFVVTSICYGLGLIVTFLGLYLMNGIAQPALLYLVPFTVIPPILIALCRGELKKLWIGPGDGSDFGLTSDNPVTADKMEETLQDSLLSGDSRSPSIVRT